MARLVDSRSSEDDDSKLVFEDKWMFGTNDVRR